MLGLQFTVNILLLIPQCIPRSMRQSARAFARFLYFSMRLSLSVVHKIKQWSCAAFIEKTCSMFHLGVWTLLLVPALSCFYPVSYTRPGPFSFHLYIPNSPTCPSYKGNYTLMPIINNSTDVKFTVPVDPTDNMIVVPCESVECTKYVQSMAWKLLSFYEVSFTEGATNYVFNIVSVNQTNVFYIILIVIFFVLLVILFLSCANCCFCFMSLHTCCRFSCVCKPGRKGKKSDTENPDRASKKKARGKKTSK